jgi:hypothetical protein
MRKKLTVAFVLALVLPSIAIAGKPPAPGKSQESNRKAPQVMYVLKGSLTGYTAAAGSADGSVTLTVKSANYHGAALKNQTLTFALPSTAKVVLHAGAAVNPTTDRGMVKVRGPKKIAATDNLASVLQALKAFRVIDQGPAS